jgi:DMSO/TMAO reductase YedYZ molybdopterin-dependent catalytic subunit
MVDRPLELTFDDLLAMDLVELDATLVCVHNPVGGDRIGTARWTGVPVRRLLQEAGPRPEAEQVLTRSLDGFTAGVPLEFIESGADALVAIGMNGAPLEIKNGFPARMLVPGLWGADANTKFLGDIELTTWAAAEDYWDRRGWPRDPRPVQPGARIDVPRGRSAHPAGRLTVAGVAWAPPQGVVGVALSIDEDEWLAAELSPEVAPTVWRQWQLRWDATPGVHDIRVRTLGRAGPQRERSQPPYPEGATGFHSARVNVLPAGAHARAHAARSAGQAIAEDVARRVTLAAMAPPAWRRHGFPRRPDFPPPSSSARGRHERAHQRGGVGV